MGVVLIFGTLCNTDVFAPFGDHKYNRRDTNPSLSLKLCLGVHKNVLHPSNLFLSSRAHHVCGSFCSSLDAGSSKSDIRVWNNREPIPLNRIEVAVNTACEQTSLSADGQQGDKPH